MNSFHVCAVAIVLCLTIFSQVHGSDEASYRKANSDIGKLMWRVKSIEKFLDRAKDTAIMTIGVKSSSDNSYVRAITSITLENGDSAQGTVISNTDVINALNNGNTYRGRVDVYGQTYVGVYKPKMDSNGDVVAYYFVGIPV